MVVREQPEEKIMNSPGIFHAKAQSNATNTKDIAHFASLAPSRELSALKIRPALFHAKAQSNATNTKDIAHFASLAPLRELSAFKFTRTYSSKDAK